MVLNYFTCSLSFLSYLDEVNDMELNYFTKCSLSFLFYLNEVNNIELNYFTKCLPFVLPEQGE